MSKKCLLIGLLALFAVVLLMACGGTPVHRMAERAATSAPQTVGTHQMNTDT